MADLDLPTESYFDDLRLYRSVSTENDVTARHIAGVLDGMDLSALVDLGCGDGILVSKVAKQIGRRIKLRGIDIDPIMYAKAKKSCGDSGAFTAVEIILGDLSDHLPMVLRDAQIITMVHVNYFLKDEEFTRLVDALPQGVPLVIVVDKEDSVFSQLWSRTAREYWTRAQFANRHLHERKDIVVTQTVVQSEIRNPWSFPKDVCDRLLSFLTYSDFRLASGTQQAWIRETVQRYVSGDAVKVETNCYLVTKQ